MSDRNAIHPDDFYEMCITSLTNLLGYKRHRAYWVAMQVNLRGLLKSSLLKEKTPGEWAELALNLYKRSRGEKALADLLVEDDIDEDDVDEDDK